MRPLLIQYTLDHDVAHGDYQALAGHAVDFGLVVQSVFQYVHTHLSGWIGQYVIRDIRVKLYKHLVGFRLRFLTAPYQQWLVTRTISDVEALADVFSEGLAALAGTCCKRFSFDIYVLYGLAPGLGELVRHPVDVIVHLYFQKSQGHLQRCAQMRSPTLMLSCGDILTGINIVQIFGSEKGIRKIQRKSIRNTKQLP